MASRDLDILVKAKGATDAARQIGKVDSAVGHLGKQAGVLKTSIGTGLGFIGAQVITRGIGSLVSAVKDAAFGMNASLETSTLQFETLMGNADEAKAHVLSLFQFAASTPFETGPIIEASRIMETFGGRVLDTKANLTLFGDAAAATSAPINEVAFWSSRMYAALEAGKPFGEASARLGELGIMAPKVRNELEKMQKDGKKGPEIWAAYQRSLGKFSGAMEKQADTWAGLTSSVKDNIAILGATSMKPIFDTAKAGMKDLLTFLSTPEAAAAATSFAADLAKIVNPENMRTAFASIKDAVEGIVQIGRNVPWGSIADAMKFAGMGARTVMEMFTGLPPWVQTAVLTGWGLNKITGGLIGQLGSGLIKGVLGMNAGVVNINAAVVNGGGGGGIGNVVGGAAKGLGLAALGVAAITGITLGVIAGLGVWALHGDPNKTGTGTGVNGTFRPGARGEFGTRPTAPVTLAPGSKVNLSETDRAMFRSQDDAQKSWVRQQLRAADTASERIGTLHSQLQSANATLEQIERNRIAVTLKNVATTIVRISANEVNRAQTTFKVYNSGSAGKYAL